MFLLCPLFYAIFCKCLVCHLLFLAMSCNFANTRLHVICVMCCFIWCFKYAFSSCNLQLFGIMSSFLFCKFLWHFLQTKMCVIYICYHFISFWYSSFLALWNFLVHVFFLPCNCLTTSSTSIVILLDVFGLFSFL